MRISDRSSDVCSSDLVEKTESLRGGGYPIDIRGSAVEVVKRMGLYERLKLSHVDTRTLEFVDQQGERIAMMAPEDIAGDRTRVGEGKRVSVRVASGGRRIITKHSKRKSDKQRY